MKSAYLIILSLLFVNSVWSADTIISFHKSQLIIPKGFIEFSKEKLNSFKTTIFNRKEMTVYEKMNSSNSLQRIIIYYDSLSQTKEFTFYKTVEIKREIIKEDGMTFYDVEVDPKNKCAFGKIIILGDTSVFGFSVDAFGIMGIQFDNSQGIDKLDLEMFEKLIKTIKHKSPYIFEPKQSSKEKSKKEMKESGVFMTIAFVVMVFVWLVRKFLVKSQ